MFDAYHLDCVDGSLYFSNDKPKEKCSKYGNCIFYEKTNKRSICSRNRNRNLFCVDFLKNQSINSAYLSTLPNESDDVLLRSPFIVLFILSSIPFFYALSLRIFVHFWPFFFSCSFLFVFFGGIRPRIAARQRISAGVGLWWHYAGPALNLFPYFRSFLFRFLFISFFFRLPPLAKWKPSFFLASLPSFFWLAKLNQSVEIFFLMASLEFTAQSPDFYNDPFFCSFHLKKREFIEKWVTWPLGGRPRGWGGFLMNIHEAGAGGHWEKKASLAFFFSFLPFLFLERNRKGNRLTSSSPEPVILDTARCSDVGWSFFFIFFWFSSV